MAEKISIDVSEDVMEGLQKLADMDKLDVEAEASELLGRVVSRALAAPVSLCVALDDESKAAFSTAAATYSIGLSKNDILTRLLLWYFTDPEAAQEVPPDIACKHRARDSYLVPRNVRGMLRDYRDRTGENSSALIRRLIRYATSMPEEEFTTLMMSIDS